MEEAKAMAQHQQQLMIQHQQQQHQQQQQQQQQHHQQQQQHHHQQQFLLLQQLQQQKQQQQQQQQAAMSRFPSNIDAHLRPPSLNRPINLQQHQNPNPNLQQHQNPNPNLQQQQQQNPSSNAQQFHHHQQQHQQQQQQQKAIRPGNQAELQMAYQDAWRVCHPDFKRPFSSLEDACERLLPYHVVADYEAEEDDRILDSDTTGQMPSRSQQWDHNIAAKVSEFLVTFEKQALAFNIISRKRATGEFRCEERLMIEQALLQEEKRAMLELRAEIESREKAGREVQEAKLRMAAMVQAEQARAESHAEMMARAPIRANALGSQGSDVSMVNDIAEQDQGENPDDMINGWENNIQRDEKEPSEDFLNDEETENGDTGMEDEWREAGEFDLNTR